MTDYFFENLWVYIFIGKKQIFYENKSEAKIEAASLSVRCGNS